MNIRWHESIMDAASNGENPMPWARGSTRNAMIQRRNARAEDEQTSVQREAKSA